jgi:hypothetical protein
VSVQTPPGPPEAPPPPAPPRDAKAELAAAKAYAKAERPWFKKKRFIALGLFVLLMVIAIAGGASSDPDKKAADRNPGAAAPPTASSDAAKSDDGGSGRCGATASDACTPDVASDQSVRVDALTWQYVSSRETSTLGNQQYGLGAKADDVFLVVKLSVTSNKDESATLTDDAIKLESSEGNTYSPDSDGTIAAMGSGEDPLFLTDLGPDQTTTSKVVFDVPQSVLDAGAKLRFNELGFGETHGYIKLPD